MKSETYPPKLFEALLYNPRIKIPIKHETLALHVDST